MNTKEIGNKIAQGRKKLNISQAQLAEHLFISAQAVGKWERGESIPDIIMLNRLAETFNVDLNYFSDNIAEPSATKRDKEDHGSSSEKQESLRWDMSGGNWMDADFSGLKDLQEKFSMSNMRNCKFVGSELTGLELKRNKIDGCNFSNSDISNSHIVESNLANNTFKDCSLQKVFMWPW